MTPTQDQINAAAAALVKYLDQKHVDVEHFELRGDTVCYSGVFSLSDCARVIAGAVVAQP